MFLKLLLVYFEFGINCCSSVELFCIRNIFFTIGHPQFLTFLTTNISNNLCTDLKFHDIIILSVFFGIDSDHPSQAKNQFRYRQY